MPDPEVGRGLVGQGAVLAFLVDLGAKPLGGTPASLRPPGHFDERPISAGVIRVGTGKNKINFFVVKSAKKVIKVFTLHGFGSDAEAFFEKLIAKRKGTVICKPD